MLLEVYLGNGHEDNSRISPLCTLFPNLYIEADGLDNLQRSFILGRGKKRWKSLQLMKSHYCVKMSQNTYLRQNSADFYNSAKQ